MMRREVGAEGKEERREVREEGPMAKRGCCDRIEALVERVALRYTGGIPMRKHVRRSEGSSYCTIDVGEGEGEGEVSRKARGEGRGASQGQGTDMDGGRKKGALG